MTLEEILKADGWSQADIDAQATLLKDPKFRGALEKQYGAMQTTLGEYKKHNDDWAKFGDTAAADKAKLEQERADAVAAQASLEARLKLAEEQGFAPRRSAGDPNPNPNPDPGGAWDAKKHNVPLWDDIHKLAAAEGEAIAIATDMQEEYRYLTGKSMLEYEANIDGRTLRGMSALLQEARRDKKPLPDYISQKFDFAGKRAQMADKRRQDAEEAIRKDERAKVTAQYGANPDVRPLVPSTNPFVRTGAGEGKPGTMPWEQNPAQLRAARLTRALETQAKGVN